jgi:hypothetical protein
MSRTVGDRLPHQILEAFDGRGLDSKIGPAYLLVTVDPDGRPRPCMLSAGEILALDERTLRLGLWPGTRTSSNLAAGSPVLLCFVAPGQVLYVKGTARALDPVGDRALARFEMSVESVESDLHEGMPVTAGITFTVEAGTPQEIAAIWRSQIESLRA